MKSLVQKIVIVLTVAATSATLHAQVRTAVFGRTTIQFSQSFTSLVGALNGSLSDLNMVPLSANSVVVPVSAGAINPGTGVGEVDHSSGFILTGGGKTIRLENFIVDTTNPVPTVSADFVFNGTVIGRLPLFNVAYPSSLTLPLPVTVGVLQVNGLKLSLAPGAASALNTIFNIRTIPAGLDAGTASIYAVFAPLPGGSL
jgi:hypothetical protein